MAAPAKLKLAPSTEDVAHAIAQALLQGFDKHYALFRDCARAAKRHFESRNFLAIGHVARDRIDFYDRRVEEAAERIEREFGSLKPGTGGADALWAHVKQHYIAMLNEHRQPECAETFFNSVSCKILHRSYFHNQFLFVRPAVSTEYLDADPPTYRCYYPRRRGLRQALIDAVLDLRFEGRFADFRRDLRNLLRAFRRKHPRPFEAATSLQIQVLASPFFRNRTAYVVGRVVNGIDVRPFAVPVRHDASGRLYVDALLLEPTELALLFSANRAYFLVDMEVPSAYVAFLQAMLPDKTAAELYTMVGLQKQGKTLFFRDFLHHLRHSTDAFVVAPGIKGLVMSVFTLPSYPYVFKVIKDRIALTKDTDRAKVKQKYALVKHHDRVGRMTDILEYSDVAFPRDRFSRDLLDELRAGATAQADPAESPPGARRRSREVPRAARVWRHDPGARKREHLRRRPPVQELRNDAVRARRLLRLRRDRVPHRLQLPPHPRAAEGRGRNVAGRVVSGRPARRVSGGVRDVPPDGRRRARGIHAAPRASPGRRVVAGCAAGDSWRRGRRGSVLSRQHPVPASACAAG
jgi:isocitrate dehydrogenase kinase/phosphatase